MLKMNGYLGPSFFDDSVISVEYALRIAGYQTRISTNTIAVDALNIIWGAGTHLGSDLAAIEAVASPSNCIIFNMEQIAGESPLVNESYLQFLRKYKVLDYNAHNIRAIHAIDSSITAREFPLVPAPSLAYFAHEHPAGWNGYEFDIGFYGAMSDRRERVLVELASNGLRVNRIAGQFGENLNRAIANTKAILNVHCYSSMIFETARVLRPLAMGLPVISETSAMPSSVNWTESGVIFADIQNLVETCTRVLNSAHLQHRATREIRTFLGNESLWIGSVASVMDELQQYSSDPKKGDGHSSLDLTVYS
jgi:hypothetical protein